MKSFPDLSGIQNNKSDIPDLYQGKTAGVLRRIKKKVPFAVKYTPLFTVNGYFNVEISRKNTGPIYGRFQAYRVDKYLLAVIHQYIFT